LASLVSQTLESAGVSSAFDDEPIQPAPDWGNESDDAAASAKLDSWEPVAEEDEIHSVVAPLPPGALLPGLPPPPRRPPPARPGAPLEAAAPAFAAGPLPAPAPVPGAALPAPARPDQTNFVAPAPAPRPARRMGRVAAGAAAALVGLCAVGWWTLTGSGGATAATSEPEATKAPSSAQARPAAQTPRPDAASRVADAPSAPAGTAAAQPPAAAQPELAKAVQDDSDLKPAEGGLRVDAKAGLRVFIQGVERGTTNQRLILPCGYRHVRLQSEQGGWVSEGRSVLLTCRTTTVLAIETEPNG
jgi:hypothetical protein